MLGRVLPYSVAFSSSGLARIPIQQVMADMGNCGTGCVMRTFQGVQCSTCSCCSLKSGPRDGLLRQGLSILAKASRETDKDADGETTVSAASTSASTSTSASWRPAAVVRSCSTSVSVQMACTCDIYTAINTACSNAAVTADTYAASLREHLMQKFTKTCVNLEGTKLLR